MKNKIHPLLQTSLARCLIFYKICIFYKIHMSYKIGIVRNGSKIPSKESIFCKVPIVNCTILFEIPGLEENA